MLPRMLPLLRHGRATGLLVALLVVGCAGELENPERFSAPSTSSCSLDIDVETDIFGTPESPAKCGLPGCHGATGTIAANLDLVSPGLESRVVGVTAQCMGLLVDPTDLESSVMIRKLLPSPSCGARMPFGGMLSDEEIDCVRAWAEEAIAIAGSSDGGAGGADAGADEDAGAADAGVDGGV